MLTCYYDMKGFRWNNGKGQDTNTNWQPLLGQALALKCGYWRVRLQSWLAVYHKPDLKCCYAALGSISRCSKILQEKVEDRPGIL